MRRFLPLIALVTVVWSSGAIANQDQRSVAATPGMDARRLSEIDTVVAEAIAAKKTPGAVVVVGRGDVIAWRKAYGQRAIEPKPEAMTLDTIFDLASLTKVVATTPAVMMLVEQGRIRLVDRVAQFIPEFDKYGKRDITVRDLLTHMSGLRPDLDMGHPWTGHDEAIRLARPFHANLDLGLVFGAADAHQA